MTAPHWARPDHHPLPRGNRQDGQHEPFTPAPRKSTAPPGLFVPAPEVIAEKAVKPKSTVGLSQRGNLARQKPCGTETAAKRHKRNGEPLCDVCEAGRAARRTTTPAPARPACPGKRCGTRQGYDDHLIRKEGTCQPCREAMAADARRRYANRAAALNPPTKHPQCGSLSGRAIHRRRGEKVCSPCRLARNEADRKKHNETEKGEAA